MISQEILGVAILPVNLLLEPASEITNAKLLLHYAKGKFYQRNAIVKVDKQNRKITFRSGEVVCQDELKKAKLKNVTGFPLAERLGNYLTRIKETSKIFL